MPPVVIATKFFLSGIFLQKSRPMVMKPGVGLMKLAANPKKDGK
jgi:hypothetical protein